MSKSSMDFRQITDFLFNFKSLAAHNENKLFFDMAYMELMKGNTILEQLERRVIRSRILGKFPIRPKGIEFNVYLDSLVDILQWYNMTDFYFGLIQKFFI